MRRLLAVLKRRSQPVSLLSGRGTALQPARAERRFRRGNVGTAEHSVRAAVGNLARAKGESCEHRAVDLAVVATRSVGAGYPPGCNNRSRSRENARLRSCHGWASRSRR
jgi:hypothetical protein